MTILQVNSLEKIYSSRLGMNQVKVLSNVNFSVEKGEYVAIMGESGSGKTTLLNILATLDKPTSGTVILDGKDISTIPEKRLAEFRRENLGFVFQDFNLLDTFSLEDNIMLPLVKRLGIYEHMKKYPYEVSGGQKQRAAVARALITNPSLVLADEPTGALDSKASDALLCLFREINKEGQTIFMVTHSVRAASHASRVLFLRDGEIFHQIYKGGQTNEMLYQKISDALTSITAGEGHYE